MPTEVLRLSHRLRRDPRLSTHVALTARAFLANKLYYSGQHDSSLETSINKVTKDFGGNFEISYIKSPINLIKEKKQKGFFIIHLTCYGLSIQKKINQIRKKKKIFIIVGGEKVPPEIYELSDLNLSITNQPHSEVGSLALFLHEYFEGKELETKFSNAKLIIKPSRGRKKVVKLNHDSQEEYTFF